MQKGHTHPRGSPAERFLHGVCEPFYMIQGPRLVCHGRLTVASSCLFSVTLKGFFCSGPECQRGDQDEALLLWILIPECDLPEQL
jgi:hypothetical protein